MPEPTNEVPNAPAAPSHPPGQGTGLPKPQDRMLQHFRYEHLPEHLRAVSAPFGRLALQIVENLPQNAERTVALRKLLEAKDCAVRAVLEG